MDGRQKVKLFWYLMTHKGISNREALVKLGIGSVSRRINDLEAEGVLIERETIKEPHTHYTMYSLNEEWRQQYMAKLKKETVDWIEAERQAVE